MTPRRALWIILLAAPGVHTDALGQAQDLKVLKYQVDKARRGEMPPREIVLAAPVEDPCFKGVGVNGAAVFNYKTILSEIELDTASFENGLHSVALWWEDAQGKRTSVHTGWFSVQKAVTPLSELKTRYRVDQGAFTDVQSWEEEKPPCPGFPERSWDVETAGLGPGIHEVEVTLVDASGRTRSSRKAFFPIHSGGILSAPVLQPDRPGEGKCDDGVEFDGDGLVDGADPECGAPLQGPVVAFQAEGDGACTDETTDGTRVFSSGELDAAQFFPGAGNPRAGFAFLLAGKECLAIPLLTKAPEWAGCCTQDPRGSCSFDPSTRTLKLGWATPIPYESTEVRLDHPAHTSCDLTRPGIPEGEGLKLPGSLTEASFEVEKAGDFIVRVLGLINDKVAFFQGYAVAQPCKGEVDIPPPGLSSLVPTAVCPDCIQLRWEEAPGWELGKVEVCRDGLKIGEVDRGVKHYKDCGQGLEEGGTYSYRVKSQASSPIPGSTASVLVEFRLVCPTAGRFRRGDSDGDGIVNLTDAIFFLKYLFQAGPEPGCLDASDADDLGDVNLTDAIYSLAWQFQGGVEPPPPGPFACGPDPTEDNLPACGDSGC